MIRGLAMPGRGALVARVPFGRSRAPRELLDAMARRAATRLLDARGRRERLLIALVLGDHLRPVEAAAALGVSVRQVNRTVSAFLDDVARAVRRAVATPLRVRRTGRARALRSAA